MMKLIAVLLLAIPSLSLAKTCGKFLVISGQVEKSKNGKTWKKAKLGQKVCNGDQVKTGSDSKAKIVMLDKNSFTIQENSQFKIDKYEYNEGGKKEAAVNLLYGALRSKVVQKYDGKKNKYQVFTKAAVVGVRGTEFLTKIDKNEKFEVVSFEGRVRVQAFEADGRRGPEIRIRPGESLSFSRGQKPPKAKKVPSNKLRKMNKDSFAEGKGPRKEARGEAKQRRDKKMSPRQRFENSRPQSNGKGPKKRVQNKAKDSMRPPTQRPTPAEVERKKQIIEQKKNSPPPSNQQKPPPPPHGH